MLPICIEQQIEYVCNMQKFNNFKVINKKLNKKLRQMNNNNNLKIIKNKINNKMHHIGVNLKFHKINQNLLTITDQ